MWRSEIWTLTDADFFCAIEFRSCFHLKVRDEKGERDRSQRKWKWFTQSIGHDDDHIFLTPWPDMEISHFCDSVYRTNCIYFYYLFAQFWLHSFMCTQTLVIDKQWPFRSAPILCPRYLALRLKNSLFYASLSYYIIPTQKNGTRRCIF